MKTVRIFAFLTCMILVGLITFQSQRITDYSIDVWQLGWMLSYCIPRVMVLVLSAIGILAVLPLIDLSKVGKAVIGILILAAFIGGYLTVNLPYINDWMRAGTAVELETESSGIGSQLQLENPDYEGIIMLALPSCPYCVQQFETLKRLKHRNTSLDVSVFVASKDSMGVETFKNHVGASEISIYRISDKQEVSRFSNGRFPSFLYFREGKVIYRWSNGQFGYPALDWVENRLN